MNYSCGTWGRSSRVWRGAGLLVRIGSVAVAGVVMGWRRGVGILVAGSAVGGIMCSGRGAGHACLMRRTEVAGAIVLLVLLVRDCCATSAHSTQLSVVGSLVALPEWRLLASARGIAVGGAWAELLLFLVLLHHEDCHDDSEEE